MSKNLDPARAIYPAHADPIRIVPLFLPDKLVQPTADALALVPAAPARLTYRNGPLLTAIEVFTVFWGAAWQQGNPKSMVSKINQFFDYILTSARIGAL